MRWFLAAFMVTAIFLSGCTGGENSSGPQTEKQGSDEGVKTYPLAYDLSEEKRLQEAVDHGGQTWRKNPLDVAHAALTNQGANVKVEDCAIVGEKGDDHCVVEVKGASGVYRVHLKRLVRPGGIWTATEIDILDKENGSSHGGHEGGHEGGHKHKTLY